MTSGAPAPAAPVAARLSDAAIFFVNGAVFGSWVSRIPEVQQRLGIGEGVLGLALLAMAVGALSAMPVAGWAVSRYGSRTPTVLSVLVFCLILPLMSVAPDAILLGASLFLFGAFNGATDVSMNAQAATIEGRYGRSIMSSFHALFSFGGLAGAALGGGLAALGVGVTQHFISATVVFGAVALIVSRNLLPGGADAAGSGPAFARPNRALAALGVVAFCALVSEGAMADWSAIYLRDVIGSGPGLAATGFAVFSLAMALGRLTGDRFIERLGPVTVLRLGGALAAAGITLVLTGGLWVALFGFAAIGIGLATLFPVTLSIAARAPGTTPGAGIAAMSSTGYFGFLLGPPLIGFVAELAGLRTALVLIVVAGLSILLLAGNASRVVKKG